MRLPAVLPVGMGHCRYQRPEVYASGKREKLWKGEWREYYIDAEGKEQSRHKSKAWSRANYTKAQAQEELDKLIRDQQQGGTKRDGSMSMEAFWEEIYYPVRAGRWGTNSRRTVEYLWRTYIKPAFGLKALKEITKSDIDLHLIKLAKAGKGKRTIEGTLKWTRSIFIEAVENDFIPKNPARKVEIPACKPAGETRSLTEAEVRELWDKTTGRDYLMGRILVMTGARINELLALTRTDLLPEGLRIDESAIDGRPSTTKNKKTRLVPISAALRAELEEWLSGHSHALMFPTVTGKIHRRSDPRMTEMRDEARTAANIPDLTFRMCRTTFATLFEGDIKDAQEMLGHSAAFTLQVYRKPIFARQQRAVEELDSRLKVVPIRKGA